MANKIGTTEEIIYTTWNRSTRKNERIDGTSELAAGTRVTKWFWCNSARQYVIIPGDASFIANGDGTVSHDNE